VEVVDGSYDDACGSPPSWRTSAGWCLSDTSWPGYEEVPRWVIEGYATIFHEV
jgi:diaminopropionate ammonia-lyase